MFFGFFVHQSNMGTLSHQNPFVFAIFYHFTRKYSMLFINYFHLLCLILLGFGVFQFKHYVETVIPQDHLCRLVKEVVFSLDTVPIEAMYSFLGQRTYHPKLLLSVLFYGYAIGVRSSRKLAERCLSDHIFIYLMQCYTPDHRTISDFRKNNLKEIEKYFVDIVRIFSKLGYTSVGNLNSKRILYTTSF